MEVTVTAQLVNHLRQEVRTKKRKLRKKLDALAALESRLSHKPAVGQIEFRVELESLWQDYGERGVIITAHKPLEDVIARAEAAFKRKNNRNDVQARCSVYAIFSGKVCLEMQVPKKFWKHLRK